MTEVTPKFDFLLEYILALLKGNNIDLTDEQKKIYIPQILAQVELRLGLKLLPQLNDEQKDKFTKLVNKSASGEELNKFWHAAVPTFDDEVKEVLMSFAEKVKQIMANQ